MPPLPSLTKILYNYKHEVVDDSIIHGTRSKHAVVRSNFLKRIEIDLKLRRV